jgi:hypothetical protein
MHERIHSVNKDLHFVFLLLFFSSGKLSSSQIKAGYTALKEIEAFIKINKFNSAFIEANNSYYTRSRFE